MTPDLKPKRKEKRLPEEKEEENAPGSWFPLDSRLLWVLSITKERETLSKYIYRNPFDLGSLDSSVAGRD